MTCEVSSLLSRAPSFRASNLGRPKSGYVRNCKQVSLTRPGQTRPTPVALINFQALSECATLILAIPVSQCDSEGSASVPACTESRFGDPHQLSSREIHDANSASGAGLWEAAFGMAPQAVAAVEWGLSPYRTDPHLMRELQPDVVLTQVGFLVLKNAVLLTIAEMRSCLRDETTGSGGAEWGPSVRRTLMKERRPDIMRMQVGFLYWAFTVVYAGFLIWGYQTNWG